MSFKTLALLAALNSCASATISFSGIAVQGAENSLSSANVTNGSLGLLIVDVQGNGFLGLPVMPPTVSQYLLGATDDPKVTEGRAGLTVGSFFGGDLVLGVLTSGSLGTLSASLNGLDVTGLENKNFAIVWFDGILASGAPANAPIGTKYGIVQGGDWTLPAVDINGTYVFSLNDASGDSSYYRANMTSSSVPEGTNFKTGTGPIDSAALFTVVPEPSSALLCVLSLLPLARRRR